MVVRKNLFKWQIRQGSRDEKLDAAKTGWLVYQPVAESRHFQGSSVARQLRGESALSQIRNA